jgi:TonB family protein
MQLRGPEPLLQEAAAAPATAAMAAPAIIGLSDDPLLLEALSGAALTGSSVITCPTADRFIDQLVANAAGIALIDASSVAAPLSGFIATVREQFPQLLLIVAGPAHLQAQLSAQLDSGDIFRFVHKPASSQRLKLFLDAAVRRLHEESPTDRRPVSPAGPTAAAPRSTGGNRSMLAFVALSAVFLAAGAIAWALWQRRSAPPEPAAAIAVVPAPSNSAETTPEPTVSARDQLAETQARDAAALEQAQRTALGARADQLAVYLQLARKRLASGALVDPADDNARSYLASALALAPEDAEVHAVSVALGEALIAQFRRALAAGDLADAQRWLQACSDYRIGTATLSELSAQLKQGQAKQAQSDTLARLQREFSQRLAAESLIEPADDSALAKFRSLKSMDAGNAALPAMERALREAIAAAAQARLVHDDANGAGQLLSAAQAAGLEGEELAAATRSLDRARAAASVPPPQTAAATAPAAVAAPPAWVSESTLKRVRFVEPVYPDSAVAKGITGWVDLEFSVSGDGSVKDIVVLAAEPTGVFEQSARTALARCRYSPVTRDGVAITPRIRIRVRFQL